MELTLKGNPAKLTKHVFGTPSPIQSAENQREHADSLANVEVVQKLKAVRKRKVHEIQLCFLTTSAATHHLKIAKTRKNVCGTAKKCPSANLVKNEKHQRKQVPKNTALKNTAPKNTAADVVRPKNKCLLTNIAVRHIQA